MQHLRSLSAAVVALSFSALLVVPHAARAGGHDEASQRRQFLTNLGFDDVPAIIRAKLARRDYHSELNRRQMESNAISYEVLNASRELSIFILSETAPDGLDPAGEKAAQLGRFAAKMLALKPLAPPTDYPAQIMLMPEGEARDVALIEWLRVERLRAMNLHKSRLISDIASLVGGRAILAKPEQVRKIDRLVTTIVDRMYMDDEIGNGKFFGRAMTALLAREEKLHADGTKPLTELLSTELKAHFNMRLENYIGDTLLVPTSSGDKMYQVENGTMMLTRYLAPGSLQISWAAVPSHFVDRMRARMKGMIGSPIASGLFVTPEDTADGLDLKMRIRDRIAQGGILREGFSHIVYYEVREDEATGIKMARVIDNYPNRVFDATDQYIRTGGTRISFPEQVIDFAHHGAVYFANPIEQKVADWSAESRTKTGYQAEFFPSVELDLKEGIIPLKNSRVANWKTTITEDDYNKLHSERDPKKLSKEIWKRYALGLEQSVYEGWTFHWPDPYDFYLVGSTYCSQLGDMVMRKFVGMPLEETTSEWHWALRMFASIGRLGEKLTKTPGMKAIGEKLLALPNVEKSMKLTKIKIIAPTSLVLQPYMKGEFFRFGSRSPEQRVQTTYLANDYREADPQLTREIERNFDLANFDQRPVNTILDAGAAMRELEYGMVMRAARGLTTHGFSAEKFAEIAVAKEEPKFKAAAAAETRRCEGVFQY